MALNGPSTTPANASGRLSNPAGRNASEACAGLACCRRYGRVPDTTRTTLLKRAIVLHCMSNDPQGESHGNRQNTVQQTDQSLRVKGAQSVAAWSLVLAGLVVGVSVCAAIGYIVFLQPNPDSNVPDLPPSDAVMETPPDETLSTSLSLSPSSKPENASEASSVGLPARYIQNEPPS